MTKYQTEEERRHAKYLSTRKWILKNKDKVKKLKRESDIRNAEHVKKHKQEYYFKNKAEWKRKKRNRVFELKQEIVKHYSKGRMCCANCGLRDVKNLTVDHINGNGERHRRTMSLSGGHSFYIWLTKLKYPPGYQILCFACNMAKGGRQIV